MTILQLKVVTAINEFGSISSAANKLGISQPNASNYLKTLEGEIGFEIFNRTKSGATLTEKGYVFLEHAKKILSEQDSIMGIQNIANKYRLRVGSINYSTAVEPFLIICENHLNDNDSDFCYYNLSIEKGIQALSNYNIDILVAPSLKTQFTGIKNACKKNNLIMVSLCEQPAAIKVRKNHPAIADGKCQNIIQGSDAMKDYPYASYRNLAEDNSSTGYDDSDYVQCSYKMYVDGVDARLHLIASTNAFSFGIMLPEHILDRYNLTAFPVPGIFLEVFCIIRKADQNKPEIQEYISLLCKELDVDIPNDYK